MSDTILKQSTNYRHRRSASNNSNNSNNKSAGIRNLILAEIISTEQDLLSLESRTEAETLRRTRQLLQSQSPEADGSRRQSRNKESQQQDFESLFSNNHDGHRHSSSSWKKQSNRLYKLMVAGNVTSSQTSAASSGENRRTYASVHLKENKLPQYSKH